MTPAHHRSVAVGPALVACAVLFLSPPLASAQSNDGWQITVAPYLTGAAMSGTLGIGPVDADVTLSASDVLDALEWGAMGMFVAKKGDWGFGADALWMALGSTRDLNQVSAVADVDQGGLAFYGVRRLTDAADFTFGARWNIIKSALALTGPAGFSVEKDKQWVDPVVGLLLHTTGSGRWHATLYSEAGGFGAGSDFAWQFFPTVGFDLSRHISLDGGWRWLGMDYASGEGAERFVYDMVIQGPTVGMVFKF